VIALRKVTKTYPGHERRAVDSLTLDISDHEVIVLIGPSGCGKSTTLRMINRLIEPDSGVIELDGADVRSMKLETLRRGIGYAIQGVGLFPHWTVRDNIGTVPWLLGWDQARKDERIAELLELVGLDPDVYARKYPDELSGGEAQRVGVARALAADPPVLLMDEPFGAVDPLTRDRLQREFLGIQARLCKTVVFVTHDMDEAIKMGDRIAVMREGALVQYDVPERVLAYPCDDFVAGFVGGERALKRLSLTRVRSIMGPREIAETGGYAEQIASAQAAARDSLAVRADADLRFALAKLLEAGLEVLPVRDEAGATIGSISLEGLMAHFKEPVS
jgi:osmoprotectant transport system ATP-binding protein